jgi:OPA family sugar phosphate sensor protein UhpC-like MFS transporter
MGEGLTYCVVELFVDWLGWRAGFWVPGVLCILAGIWIYAMMQDRPPTLGLPTIANWKNDHLAEAAPKEARVLTLQFSILRIPAIWVLAASSATVYVTRYAIASWGILYLQEERGYGLADASIFMAVGTLAGIAGCLLYGLTSDKLFAARRPPTNLLFAIAELAGLLLIFFGPQDVVALTAGFILFGIGLSGLVTSLGGLFAVDIAPKKVAGAAMGFIGVFSYLGAAVQENISGALIESGMQVVGDARTYDFGPAIAFWIGSSAVSMVLAATLWRVRLRE